jgi:hypothetical protein
MRHTQTMTRTQTVETVSSPPATIGIGPGESVAVGMAVIRNPFAGQFVEDLRPLFEAGAMLGLRLMIRWVLPMPGLTRANSPGAPRASGHRRGLRRSGRLRSASVHPLAIQAVAEFGFSVRARSRALAPAERLL